METSSFGQLHTCSEVLAPFLRKKNELMMMPLTTVNDSKLIQPRGQDASRRQWFVGNH